MALKLHQSNSAGEIVPVAGKPRNGIGRSAAIACLLLGCVGCLVVADWWNGFPNDAQATYVGRSRCVECHQSQADQWTGSHHDMAMDDANEGTVLGDFNDASLTHFGITSRMFRRDGKFMIHTEGRDGKTHDFEIKYVFGVDPLQQYMVEVQPPASAKPGDIGRVQVLRVSWDIPAKRWFYLPPPDVDEKLEPNDPLHWTGWAQNWNHMCADCHSTNLRKNFDLATATYHTNFSEIDVSCEACHGPGSLHVKLAKSKSLFWDRRHGYGLARLKSTDSRVEIETCARCHSRRHVVHPDHRPGESYYDFYVNELLQPETYYPDGQIKDEVYVYGSFIQSKMYHKDVRCTDCHNPHTARLKFEGNKLCTSCHAHNPAIYDTPTHHGHKMDSAGASCVECHMPATPFMEIDPRRDHSFTVPRPDRSLKLGTPNACTGCHLDPQNIAPEKRRQLQHYADWLEAARAGDQQVKRELARADQWAVDRLHGLKSNSTVTGAEQRVEFAEILARAWRHETGVLPELTELAANRRAAGIVRASALAQLSQFPPRSYLKMSVQLVEDPDPQVRIAAISTLNGLPVRDLLRTLTPILDDPIRSVRIEAARRLAYLPELSLTAQQQLLLDHALGDFRHGLLEHADQASAHMGLGELAERQRDLSQAVESYQNAIRVQPNVTGPRANLADVLERLDRTEEAARYRRQELTLLERDARLAPENSAVQYRLGLSYYLQQREAEAEQALARSCRLDPMVPEFRLMLTLLYQKQQRWKDALDSAKQLVALRPGDATYRQILVQINQQATAGGAQ